MGTNDAVQGVLGIGILDLTRPNIRIEIKIQIKIACTGHQVETGHITVDDTIGNAKSRNETFQLHINIKLYRESDEIRGGTGFFMNAQVDEVCNQGPPAFLGRQNAHEATIKIFNKIKE